MSSKFKTESLEQFIARGGTVKKIPINVSSQAESTVNKTTNGGPITILSLEDADLFYGEGQPPKPTKSKAKFDLSALPEHLKTKFLNKFRDGVDDGEEEN